MHGRGNLPELFARWEREGRPPPEEICKDCPDALDELKRAIAAGEAPELLETTITKGKVAPLQPAPIGLASSSHSRPPNRDDGGDGHIETTILGRYRRERLLGKGAFGEVWKVRDLVLDIVVAIKIPRADRSVTGEQIELFVNEARKQARLDHPSIVKVRHAEGDCDSFVIVTDYVEGKSLRDQLKRGIPEARVSAQIVADLASALDAAHRQRMIHRDVKPSNVIIDMNGRPHLTDFGLALAEEDQRRQRDQIAGTFAYMSPEQIRGESHLLDGRSDLYGLGIVLYRLLTGEVPFNADNYSDYYEQILKREPKPPRSIVDTAPEELERICLKCLAKKVNERYATGSDLELDLRRYLRKSPWKSWHRVAGSVLLCLLAFLMFLLPDADKASADKASAKPIAVETKVAPPRLPNGWAPLWTELPEKLEWPGQASGALLELLPRERAIWVVCNQDALLELGEVTKKTFRLRMTIRPLNWQAKIGVFLGRRTFNAGAVQRSRFQLIRIIPTYPEGKLQYLLSRVSVGSYYRGSPHGTQLAAAKIDEPVGGCELEIFVKDDKLQHVVWDGKKHELRGNTEEADVSYLGGFGVYARGAAVRFHQPALNEE